MYCFPQTEATCRFRSRLDKTFQSNIDSFSLVGWMKHSTEPPRSMCPCAVLVSHSLSYTVLLSDWERWCLSIEGDKSQYGVILTLHCGILWHMTNLPSSASSEKYQQRNFFSLSLTNRFRHMLYLCWIGYNKLLGCLYYTLSKETKSILALYSYHSWLNQYDKKFSFEMFLASAKCMSQGQPPKN